MGVIPADLGTEVGLAHIYEDSPAAEAGLVVGDILVSVDDRVVRNGRDLHTVLDEAEPATALRVVYRRAGVSERVQVRLRPAVGVYRRACEAGDLEGCVSLGQILMQGDGLPADRHWAREVMADACERGAISACISLGFDLQEEGPDENPAEAARLFRAACDVGASTGCFNLGVLNSKGRGVPSDESLASRLFFQACELGNAEACFVTSRRLVEQRGAPPPGVPSAAELQQRACEAGYRKACQRYSMQVGPTPAPPPRRAVRQPVPPAAAERARPDPARLAALRAAAICVGAWQVEAGIQYHASQDSPARCREEVQRGALQRCPPPVEGALGGGWRPVASMWLDLGEGSEPLAWFTSCP